MNFRLARPAYPIDINAVAGLDRLAAEDGIPPIGALVRHADFEHPVDPGPLGAMLAAVARHVRHYPIQVRGTFCGSLADADPAAEWSLIAATLGAEQVAVSTGGPRRMAASDFLPGPNAHCAETRRAACRSKIADCASLQPFWLCTPGFLMLAIGVLGREPDIGDEALRDVLTSNLCRCTGYQGIVAAMRAVIAELGRSNGSA